MTTGTSFDAFDVVNILDGFTVTDQGTDFAGTTMLFTRDGLEFPVHLRVEVTWLEFAGNQNRQAFLGTRGDGATTRTVDFELEPIGAVYGAVGRRVVEGNDLKLLIRASDKALLAAAPPLVAPVIDRPYVFELDDDGTDVIVSLTDTVTNELLTVTVAPSFSGTGNQAAITGNRGLRFRDLEVCPAGRVPALEPNRDCSRFTDGALCESVGRCDDATCSGACAFVTDTCLPECEAITDRDRCNAQSGCLFFLAECITL